MSIKIKLSQRAKAEIEHYNLANNAAYNTAITAYINDLERQKARYGKNYGHKLSTPEKNMIKALRMLPWRNSPDDWARLHVAEASKK